jgi:hypothetical protein
MYVPKRKNVNIYRHIYEYYLGIPNFQKSKSTILHFNFFVKNIKNTIDENAFLEHYLKA